MCFRAPPGRYGGNCWALRTLNDILLALADQQSGLLEVRRMLGVPGGKRAVDEHVAQGQGR